MAAVILKYAHAVKTFGWRDTLIKMYTVSLQFSVHCRRYILCAVSIVQCILGTQAATTFDAPVENMVIEAGIGSTQAPTYISAGLSEGKGRRSYPPTLPTSGFYDRALFTAAFAAPAVMPKTCQNSCLFTRGSYVCFCDSGREVE